MKPTYDRAQIMREANRLTRQGVPRSEAMKAAWRAAKAPGPIIGPRQQEAGLRAALRRYGIDPDKIALRAQEAVKAIVAAIAQDKPLMLPRYRYTEVEMTRGEDGVYRI